MQDSPGYLKTKDWGNTVRYFEHNKQFYTHLQKRKEKNGSKKKKKLSDKPHSAERNSMKMATHSLDNKSLLQNK